MKEAVRNTRKTRVGSVVSNKMQKTVIVRIERSLRHPRYEKVVFRAKKYYAHCEPELGVIPVGAKVRIVETRPLSKLKRWRVEEVIG